MEEEESEMPDEPGQANTPESLGVTPRFVLQHNAISRSIHDLSATAKKLTAMAMALLPADLSSLTAAFTYLDFCKATGYSVGGEEFKGFKKAVKECLDNKIIIETKSPKTGKDVWEGYTWFTYSKIDDGTGVCTMKFSPEFAEVLIEMKRVYAKINLRDLGALQSKYALRLFEIAKSYESLAGKDGNDSDTWYYERPVQELRKILGVSDDAYPETKRFRQKVIEEPVKEINAAGIGLEITTESIKQGRRLAAIRVNCKKTARKTPAKKGRKKKTEAGGQLELPESTTPPQADGVCCSFKVLDSGYIPSDFALRGGVCTLRHESGPKTADNRLEKESRHLLELYPEEFAALYEKALEELPGISKKFGESLRQLVAEQKALEALKERHGIVK